MAYCGPRGIPHSHFLGGPAVWTEADRQKAMAWQDRQARVHGPCGTDPDEWNPAKGGDRHAWTYEVTVCPGCEQLERAQAHMQGPEWEGQRGLQLTRRRPQRQPAG